MDSNQLRNIVEAALLAAGRPLSVDAILKLFDDNDPPARQEVRAALMELQADYAERGIRLVEVASGFRVQVDQSMNPWLGKLWEERPPRYSRALMETLAIIAYRQPVTRGDVEEIRGVTVTTNIIRTLLERNWIRVVGHRDVPGKPAMFGTTREFLDYFGLKKLDDLPPLAELKDLDAIAVQLDLPDELGAAEGGEAAVEAEVEGDAEVGQDLPPGAVAPLVRQHSADDETSESATVTSIDDARSATGGPDSVLDRDSATAAADSGDDDEPSSANVVPLKTS